MASASAASSTEASRRVEATQRAVRHSSRPVVPARGRRSVRADRPGAPARVLRDAADDELVRLAGPAVEDVVRLFPEIQAAWASRVPCRIGPRSRRRSAARAACSRRSSGSSGRLSERRAGAARPRGPARRRRRHPRPRHVLARIRRHHRVCLVATFQPDELTRDHPLTRDARRDLGRRPAGTPIRIRDRPARAVRARGARPGDRGRAAERRRRSCSSPSARAASRSSPRSCSPRGASCRARRLTGVVRGPRHRPPRAPLARSAGASCASLALAGRPRQPATSWPRPRRRSS